jgi:polar amino acid transport system substrate-binding protein
MITRRQLTAGLLGGAGVVSQRGAARAQGAETVMARVQRTKIVRFGVVNGQPPYCYRDIATGEWRGFLVDITKDLASQLGAGVQPVESTWGNAVLDIQAGKVDLFFGLAPTPDRAKVVDFTKPLFQMPFR